jgi:hypothetical protein
MVRPSTKDAMFTLVAGVWDDIPQNTIETLINSMPDRMRAVIKARGGATSW